jgi:hypothetical protein
MSWRSQVQSLLTGRLNLYYSYVPGEPVGWTLLEEHVAGPIGT